MPDSARPNAGAPPDVRARLIDSLEAAIFATDLQGRLVLFNKHAEQLFGWSAAEIIGQNIALLHAAPEDQQQLQDVVRFAGIGRTWSGDIIANRRDGSTFSARVSLSPVRDREDRIVAIAGIGVEAAVRSEVEAKLRESEARLHFALNVGGAFIWELNVRTGEAIRSHSTAGVVGFASSHVERTLERIHPDDRERVRAEFSEAIAAKQPLQTEYRFVHPDGHTIWLYSKGQIMPDPGGQDEKWVGVLLDVTERKALELRLQESESRFRDFAEIASDWLWEMDENFVVTSVVGRSHPSFDDKSPWTIGKTPWEANGFQGMPDEWRRHLEEHLYLHKPFVDFEHDLNVGRESRRCSSRGHPVFDDAGRFRGYRCATTDKTARHRAELELKSGARQQQAMATLSQMALNRTPLDQMLEVAVRLVADTLDAPLVGIFERSDDGQPLLLKAGVGCDPEIGEQGGLQCLAEQAMASSDPIVVDDLRSDGRFIPAASDVDNGAVSGVAARVAMRHGRYGALVALASGPGAFRQGQVAFVQAIAFVLASAVEQQATERILRLRDRALDAINQGIVIADARQVDDPIIYVNPTFERITGYTAEEARGRNCRFLQGHNSDRRIVHEMRSALAERRTFAGMILNYRKDGTEFWNEITLAPVTNDRGEVTHFVGTQADVTKRLELEAQLSQAQKMEAVGQLTGGIAHDFNNLLTVIIGNAEVITQESDAPPMVKRVADMILVAAERGAELTQRLLAFGRRQALRPEHIDLNAVVRGMLDLLRRAIGEQISLTVDAARDLPSAFVDKSLLETALLNLVINARDAMPRGGTLTISTRSLDVSQPSEADLEPGHYVEVAVTDTGVGMSAEVRHRAFEPFFTTKPVGKGSGLGLAMVYGFAKQSGGHVRIESELGRGTSVRVALPRSMNVRSSAARSESAVTAPLGRGEKILIVEDEPALRRWVASTVAALGYTPLDVADGRAALNILERDDSIAVLFTDIVLAGGMTGLELAEAAQRLRPDLRVLFTSGYSEELIVGSGSAFSGLRILPKPYRRNVLATRLQEVMGHSAYNSVT